MTTTQKETTQEEENEENYYFSKKGVIEKNIAQHRKYNIEEKNNQYICVVVGDTGTGKTALSLMIERYIKNGDINLDTVCLKHEDFIKEYTTKPKRKVIVYEEGRFSFDKNKYSHTETKEARDKINQYRKFHHALFVNFQNPDHLTSELVRNADALIRTPQQGIAHYYNGHSINQMWRRGKFVGWKDWDARDFFPDPEKEMPELWERYEDQADEELENRDLEDESSGENDGEDLEKHYDLSEAGELTGLSKSSLRNYCKNDEDVDCKKVGKQGKFVIAESSVKGLMKEV